MRLLHLMAILALAGAAAAQNDAANKKQPNNKEIADLVVKLGDPQFTVRQEAHKALVEIGKPALPHLRKAAEGANLEVARRARRIIQEIEAPPKLQKSRV